MPPEWPLDEEDGDSTEFDWPPTKDDLKKVIQESNGPQRLKELLLELAECVNDEKRVDDRNDCTWGVLLNEDTCVYIGLQRY